MKVGRELAFDSAVFKWQNRISKAGASLEETERVLYTLTLKISEEGKTLVLFSSDRHAVSELHARGRRMDELQEIVTDCGPRRQLSTARWMVGSQEEPRAT